MNGIDADNQFRVLIIDDNQAIHEDFRKTLGPRNESDSAIDAESSLLFDDPAPVDAFPRLEIDSAFQGQEGLAKITGALRAGRPYAMAFVDVRMPPGWDGIETIDHLWKQDPSLQIVICTAFSDYSWEDLHQRLGMTDQLLILKKPFDSVEARQFACSMVKKWKVTRELKAHVEGLKSLVNERTAELERSLSLTQAAFEATADGLLVVSCDGRIVDFNRRFLELWSVADAENVKNDKDRIWNFIRGQLADPEEFLTRLRGAKPDESSEKRDVRELRNGRILECSSLPQRIGGQTMGRVWSFSDIAERKRIERELGGARDAAVESARLKAEFLANMSHEIRTPMNGVMGMTDLLLDTALNKQQRHFAQTIRNSADALLAIVNDILDFSKIEAGKLNLETIDFNFHKALEDVLELLAEKAHEKGVNLAGHVNGQAPVHLRGDLYRLKQILVNLIGNAVKFTDQGEVVVKVTLESETKTEAVIRCEVRDTGIGISPETQARLFQAFSQADGSMTRRYGGTGLGLAITRQLVTLMNGQIGVQSRPGEGSTFWFSIPFEKQAEVAIAVKSVRSDLAGVRVLIVDDNETNREILRRQTLGWRMRNDLGANALEALEKLRAAAAKGDPYEIGILDMQLPGMDGLGLARAIKADPAIARIRLMILTSLGQELGAEILADSGVDDYHTKPITQTQLFDCLMDLRESLGARGAAESVAALAPKAAAPAGAVAGSIRILLAEDSAINQEVALGQLSRLGYAADVATNGIEVLVALQREHYDVIFMDGQMPELDGYETTRRIRQNPPPQDSARPVHIIAMTANAMKGDREKCLDAGMDDYLSKPVRPTELEATLLRWKRKYGLDQIPEPPPAAEVPIRANANGNGVCGAGIHNGPGAAAPEDPVDLERLDEVSGGDAARKRKLILQYLSHAAGLMSELGAAVQSASAAEIKRVAHKLGGASSSCGMAAIVPPLRQLEQLGAAGAVADAHPLYLEATEQLDHIRRFCLEAVAPGNGSRPGFQP